MSYQESANLRQSSSAKMRHVVLRIVGLLLIISSLIMVPPIFIGMIYQDGDIQPFVYGSTLLFTLGSILLIIFRKAKSDLKL